MKSFINLLTISFLFSLMAGDAFSQGMQLNQVVLNVVQCDTSVGIGDYFAELYGTDESGNIQDYSKVQEDGYFVFDSISSGTYEIAVFRDGLKFYKLENVLIDEDIVKDITLLQQTLPPSNFSVDPKTLVVSWGNPESELLNEGFEGETFPPDGWQSYGLYRSNDTIDPSVPDWSSYFAAAPESGYDGELYLETPPLDLRGAASYKLCFDYFKSVYFMGSMNVVYSDDGGNSWTSLVELINNDPEWHGDELDLTFLSGVNGKRSVVIRFRFLVYDGYSYPAAIDNISVVSEVPSPQTYSLILDNQLYDTLSGSVHSDTLECLDYGEQHQLSIYANYSCVSSHALFNDFTSTYLPPVKQPFIEYSTGSDVVKFILTPDDSCDTLWQDQGVLSFNIYKDGSLISNIPYDPDPDDYTIAFDNPQPNNHQYCVEVVYDLGYWGYPGKTDISKMVCQDVFVAYGKDLPFAEEWSSGGFDFNNWDRIGDGIEIDEENGIPAPSVVFFNSEGRNTEQNLVSDNIRTDQVSVGAVWFDFDVKLEDTLVNNSQMFAAYLFDNNYNWHTLVIKTGSSGFDWESKHIEVSYNVKGIVTKMKFQTTTDDENTIRKWYIDNVKLYRKCQMPHQLFADYIWEGKFGVALYWYFVRSSTNAENNGLQGFNIYRKTDSMDDYELFDFVPFDEDGSYTYKDMAPNVDPQTVYYYKVAAFYADEQDTLLSEFAESSFSTDEDFVSVLVTAEPETIELNSSVSVYPNPVNDNLFISSLDYFSRIEFFNSKGVSIYAKNNIHTKTVKISISGFKPGVYLLKIEKGDTTIIKRVVVVH